MYQKLILAAAAMALTGAVAAVAQPQEGVPGAGLRLARQQCATCHAVRSEQGTGAMSFVHIANMPSTTSMSLRAFLLTPHPKMPDIRSTPAQIDDLVAYILSLRRR